MTGITSGSITSEDFNLADHTVDVDFDNATVSIDEMRMALDDVVTDRYPLSYANITREQAKVLINSDAAHLVVDVRDPDEYCGPYGHIPGSVSASWNYGVLQTEYDTLLPTSGHLVLVCRSGNRSVEAASWLNQHPDSSRFSLIHSDTLTVYNILGGIKSWIDVTPFDEPGPDAYPIDDCTEGLIFSWPMMMPAILGNSRNN